MEWTANKISLRSLMFCVVFASFGAGIETATTFQRFIHYREDDGWFVSLFLALVFAFMACQWAIRLLSRIQEKRVSA
jgi:hypothetical protein